MKIYSDGKVMAIGSGTSESDSTTVKVLTKAEYTALPEEEKQADVLYGITDDGGSGGGGDPENVYSTEETKVGTWIDGKPVYRRTFSTETTSAYNSSYPLHLWNLADSNLETLVSFSGTVRSNGELRPLISTNYPSDTRIQESSSYGNFAILITPNYALPIGSHVVAIVEYTKTTDTGGT